MRKSLIILLVGITILTGCKTPQNRSPVHFITAEVGFSGASDSIHYETSDSLITVDSIYSFIYNKKYNLSQIRTQLDSATTNFKEDTTNKYFDDTLTHIIATRIAIKTNDDIIRSFIIKSKQGYFHLYYSYKHKELLFIKDCDLCIDYRAYIIRANSDQPEIKKLIDTIFSNKKILFYKREAFISDSLHPNMKGMRITPPEPIKSILQ